MHVFSSLKNNQSMDLCYDPTKLNIKEATIIHGETAAGRATIMKLMYPDARDLKPSNAPTPLGCSVKLNAFVNENLAGELTRRRSQTGIIRLGNMAPLIWYSKRQNTVKCYTFSSIFLPSTFSLKSLKA